MTTNNFLNGLGNPTKVDAEIGEHYREGGLPQAFAFIDQHLKPLLLTQIKKLR